MEHNQTVARHVLEAAWNEGNLSVLDHAIDQNIVDHARTPVSMDGIDKFKQIVAWFRMAFPDLYFTIQDEIATGDKVVHRWHIRGTHKGNFMGIIPPTGRSIELTGITIMRFAGGQIVERWSNFDEAGVLRQLGARISFK